MLTVPPSTVTPNPPERDPPEIVAVPPSTAIARCWGPAFSEPPVTISVPPLLTVTAGYALSLLVSTESPSAMVSVAPLPTMIGTVVLRLAWAGGAPATASRRSRPKAFGPERRDRALGTESDRYR